jgi:hypothetical protein
MPEFIFGFVAGAAAMAFILLGLRLFICGPHN